MLGKNELTGVLVSFPGKRFIPVALMLLVFTVGKTKGEGKEIILINGSQVYSFTREEFTLNESVLTDENMVYYLVDEYPVFEQIKEIKDFAESLIEYPKEAIASQVEGVVMVNFIVEKDGTVSNPRFLRTLGFGCEEEVLRVINKLPVARPGMVSGRPVRVGMTVPVRFKL